MNRSQRRRAAHQAKKTKSPGNRALVAALVTDESFLVPTRRVVQLGESIAAAIEASAPGDVVELAPGTHTPPGSIPVNTMVTLRGAAPFLALGEFSR